jgi:putative RNA 2'-phosphotransferase
MDEKRREQISRLLSLMLRHKPERFYLDLDIQGYGPVEEVIEGLRQKVDDVTEEEVIEIVDGPEKRRFELKDGRIRARYGHSFPIDLGLETTEPPEFLYFATVPDQVRAIATGGIRPGDRQYVHLSMTSEIATQVARNRTETPVVFCIKAREAAQAGIEFYDRQPVMLTRGIPAEFIEPEQYGSPGMPSLYGRKKKLAFPRK